MTTKAAVYCRVSTDEQRERQTIDQQVLAGEEYCRSKGYEIVDSFLDDGVSGSTPFEERPAGARLLAARGAFSKVVVTYVDRLGRDTVEGLLASKLLTDLGAPVEFVYQSFDDTPEGEFTFTVMLGVAKLERSLIRRRTMTGIRSRIKSGQMYRASTPPYGYRYNTDTKQLEIREDTAAIVRTVYEMYLGGKGTHAIASRLNDANVPVPSEGTNRTNTKGWHYSRLLEFLKNPVYKGCGEYGKEKIPMLAPAIIDPDLFDRVQVVIQRRADMSPRNTHQFYLLRGLLFCGRCGGRFSSLTTGAGKKVYRCAAQSRYRGAGHAGMRGQWAASLLDGHAKAFLKAFLSHPEIVLLHVDHKVAVLAESLKEKGEEVAPLQRELEAAIAEEGKILDLAQRGLYKNEAQMLERLGAQREKQKKLEARIKALERPMTTAQEQREALERMRVELWGMMAQAKSLKDRGAPVRIDWKEMTDVETRTMLIHLVEKIIVKDDGGIIYEGVLAVPGPESGTLPVIPDYADAHFLETPPCHSRGSKTIAWSYQEAAS